MKKQFFCFLITLVFQNFYCPAQIPVSQEPRHHKILDNTHVRLLDVHIPPGDTSQMHVHREPSVFLILTHVKTGSEVIAEEDKSKYPVKRFGDIYFEGFYTQNRIHRVWNSDTAEFHVMDIELPNKNLAVIDPPIQQNHFSLLFEEKPVRAYRLVIPAGEEISLSGRTANILLILLSDSAGKMFTSLYYPESQKTSQKQFLQKGDFFYIPSYTSIKISNEGNIKSEFAFFELK